MKLYFLASFKIFLFVFGFLQFKYNLCLGMILFFLIYSAQCSLSLNIWLNLSLLISIISFWKFSAIIMSSIWQSKNIWHINILLLAFLLWYATPSWNFYTILGCSVLVFIFFSLGCFSLGSFYFPVKFHWFFLVVSSLLMSPSNTFFIWLTMSVIPSIFFWFIFLEFPYLCKHCPSIFFFYLGIFFIRALNKLIIVI